MSICEAFKAVWAANMNGIRHLPGWPHMRRDGATLAAKLAGVGHRQRRFPGLGKHSALI